MEIVCVSVLIFPFFFLFSLIKYDCYTCSKYTIILLSIQLIEASGRQIQIDIVYDLHMKRRRTNERTEYKTWSTILKVFSAWNWYVVICINTMQCGVDSVIAVYCSSFLWYFFNPKDIDWTVSDSPLSKKNKKDFWKSMKLYELL